MQRTIALLASTPFLLAACSLVTTQGPPGGHEKMMTPFSCTEDWAAPALDIALSVLGLGLATVNDPDSPGLSTHAAVFGAIFGVSAAIGFVQVSQCQAARRALTQRQAEAAARRSAADLMPVQKVLITDGHDTLTVGDRARFVATAYDSTGAAIVDKMFAWSSSNDTIASVTASGLVRALEAGTVVINANAGKVIGTVNVVVVPAVERAGTNR